MQKCATFKWESDCVPASWRNPAVSGVVKSLGSAAKLVRSSMRAPDLAPVSTECRTLTPPNVIQGPGRALSHALGLHGTDIRGQVGLEC